jgi:hypothetical protein
LSSKRADLPADVWSLGVLAVELFTGVLLRAPESPLPEPWDAIVERLLQEDPDARPANAMEVARLLPPPPAVEAVWVDHCRMLTPRTTPIVFDPSEDGISEPPTDPGGPNRRAWWALALAGAVAFAMVLVGLRIGTGPTAPPSLVVVPAPDIGAVALYPHRTEERIVAPAPPAPHVKPADPVQVWVKTRPWGYVTVGDTRWATEDVHMRLPPGHHVMKLESDNGQYVVELPFDVVAAGPNRVCWDFAKAAPCSP